jgi:transmembrane sensor
LNNAENDSIPGRDADSQSGEPGVHSELLDSLERLASRTLEAALPDRRLIVLQGLVDAGEAEALSNSETALVGRHQEALARVVTEHPALAEATRRVAKDVALFNDAWKEHLAVSRAAVRPRRDRRMRWPARIGLGLSAMALGSMIYFAVLQETQQVVVTAPATAVRVVELEDGSTARLSPGSSLSYVNEAEFGRAVKLDGDAFFHVLPGNTGFTVTTAHARTSVLGTRFSVSSRGDRTEVVLVTGKVAVSSLGLPTEMVVLRPGEFTSVSAATVPTTPAEANLSETLSWTNLLIFRETPMSLVARRLGEARGAGINLSPELDTLLVTGTFGPEQPVKEILDILAATLQADVVALDDGSYRLQSAR